MPQVNQNFPSVNPAGQGAPTHTGGDGALLTGTGGLSQKNITTPTVIKTGAGRVAKVAVIVAGSTVGTINDVATTGAAAAANQVGVIPTAVGSYTFDFPVSVGLVVVPGTGSTIAVSYS